MAKRKRDVIDFTLDSEEEGSGKRARLGEDEELKRMVEVLRQPSSEEVELDKHRILMPSASADTVDFLRTHYACGVCLELPCDGRQLACGHYYCAKPCLKKLQSMYNDKVCMPESKDVRLCAFRCVVPSNAAVELPRSVRSMLDSLRFFCGYCDYIGSLSTRVDHATSCSKAPRTCPLCNQLVAKSDLAHHKENLCSGRTVDCDACTMSFPARDLDMHINSVCPEQVVVCPNSPCTVRVLRKDLLPHTNACPEHLVPCLHHKICSVLVKRKLLYAHCNTPDHVALVNSRLDVTCASTNKPDDKFMRQLCRDMFSAKGAMLEEDARKAKNKDTARRLCGTAVVTYSMAIDSQEPAPLAFVRMAMIARYGLAGRADLENARRCITSAVELKDARALSIDILWQIEEMCAQGLRLYEPTVEYTNLCIGTWRNVLVNQCDAKDPVRALLLSLGVDTGAPYTRRGIVGCQSELYEAAVHGNCHVSYAVLLTLLQQNLYPNDLPELPETSFSYKPDALQRLSLLLRGRV